MAKVDELQKQLEVLKLSFQEFKKHTHGSGNSQKLNPTSFLGFPVRVVADASVAPAYASITGQIIFQIDNKSGTPHWYLWTYLLNAKTGAYAWHFVALT